MASAATAGPIRPAPRTTSRLTRGRPRAARSGPGAASEAHGRMGEMRDRCRSVADRLRRGLPVVVVAFAGLPAEIAALDALLELGGRAVLRILRRRVRLEARVVADVEPGQIAQPEGAHREVETELHGLVDLPERRDALLEQVVRLVAECAED